jgi:hypothetical protein
LPVDEEFDWAKVFAGILAASPKHKATVTIVKRDEYLSQAMIKLSSSGAKFF